MCNGVDKENIVLVILLISCTEVQASLEVSNRCDVLYTSLFS